MINQYQPINTGIIKHINNFNHINHINHIDQQVY